MSNVDSWCKACGEVDLPSELQDLEDAIHHHQGIYEHITLAYSEVSRQSHLRWKAAVLYPTRTWGERVQFCLAQRQLVDSVVKCSLVVTFERCVCEGGGWGSCQRGWSAVSRLLLAL